MKCSENDAGRGGPPPLRPPHADGSPRAPALPLLRRVSEARVTCVLEPAQQIIACVKFWLLRYSNELNLTLQLHSTHSCQSGDSEGCFQDFPITFMWWDGYERFTWFSPFSCKLNTESWAMPDTEHHQLNLTKTYQFQLYKLGYLHHL